METRQGHSEAGEAQAECEARVVYRGADVQWGVVTQAEKSGDMGVGITEVRTETVRWR